MLEGKRPKKAFSGSLFSLMTHFILFPCTEMSVTSTILNLKMGYFTSSVTVTFFIETFSTHTIMTTITKADILLGKSVLRK